MNYKPWINQNSLVLKEQEKLRTDLTNLKNRKEEITKNQASVRLDLNLEKEELEKKVPNMN